MILVFQLSNHGKQKRSKKNEEETTTSNPDNPLKTMFSISNGGYAPLTNLQVECLVNFSTVETHATVSGAIRTSFISGPIWHSKRKTLPCIRIASLSDDPIIPNGGALVRFGIDSHLARADLTIKITYSVFGMTVKALRRSQTFHITAVRGKDGSYLWAHD